MFEKKLNSKELEEIRKRTELINQHIQIAQALEVQKKIYFKNILPKYGLDMNQNYEINLESGKIKKTKKPKPKE